MKISAFVFSSFLLSYAYAADSACVEKYEIFDENTQVQVISSSDKCFVSVHPRDAFEDMIYRDYMFDDRGLFMVFDSYGQGSESSTTAAREFLFFPRNVAALGYKYDAASKRLHVTTVGGKVFTFDTVKTVLVEVSGSTLKQNYSVKPEHKGGLEFVKNDGLFMDGGFQRGQSPNQNTKSPVQFKDAAGNLCNLRNGDIYDYAIQDEPKFKFDDRGITKFLQSRCANMKSSTETLK